MEVGVGISTVEKCWSFDFFCYEKKKKRGFEGGGKGCNLQDPPFAGPIGAAAGSSVQARLQGCSPQGHGRRPCSCVRLFFYFFYFYFFC